MDIRTAIYSPWEMETPMTLGREVELRTVFRLAGAMEVAADPTRPVVFVHPDDARAFEDWAGSVWYRAGLERLPGSGTATVDGFRFLRSV